jgi:7-cyano-7-deazaguanine reductase
MISENPLGKATSIPEHYSPQVLFPIPRQQARAQLGLGAEALPFRGEDVWRAWEVSWLGPRGVPESRVGRFKLDCTSPNLIESKSLKLYLNSLNQTQYESHDHVLEVLQEDLSLVAGAAVQVELLALDSESLKIGPMPGVPVDDLTPGGSREKPDAGLLRTLPQPVEEVLHSHLLRSLCPVTAQPDWASVIVRYRGNKILPQSLLAYILSYRRHQEFHEQCVERIFCDLQAACQPTRLSVQALFTRRGGLDINPFRSTEPGGAESLRSARQ